MARISYPSIKRINHSETATGFYLITYDYGIKHKFTSEHEVPAKSTLKTRVPLEDANETYESILSRAKLQMKSDLEEMIVAFD